MPITYDSIDRFIRVLYALPGAPSQEELQADLQVNVHNDPLLTAITRALVHQKIDITSVHSHLSEAEVEQAVASANIDLVLLTRLVQARYLSMNNRVEDAITYLLGGTPHISAATPNMQIMYWYRIGTAYFKVRLVEEARTALLTAKQIADTMGKTVDQAMLLTEMANVDLDSGDPVLALTRYEESYRILTDTGSTLQAQKVLVNIATASHRLGKIADAVGHYRDLLVHLPSNSDDTLRFTVLYNLATAFQSLDDHASALETFNALHHEATDKGSTEFQARALLGCGLSLVLCGSHDDGLRELHKARALFLKCGMMLDVSTVDGTIADMLQKVGRDEEALALLEEAFKRVAETQYHSVTLILGTSLEELYNKLSRHTDANTILKRILAIKESIYAKESERSLELSRIRMVAASEREAAIQRENERRRVLHSVLPEHIANRLLAGEQRIAERLPLVGVLFADIVGFTQMSATRSSTTLLSSLEALFQAIDDVVVNHNCQRIKTIGDAYMACSGLGTDQEPHDIVRLVRCALSIIDLQKDSRFKSFPMRLGLHAGPVIAGVMQGMRMAYDMWGDAVNIASRMEGLSEPNRLLVTETVATLISPLDEFVLSQPIYLTVRGRGDMNAYWVEYKG